MPTPEAVREWMPKGDPVHDYDHVMRVYQMAEKIALAEGADLDVVRAAALLHDAVGSAPSHEADGQRHDHHGSSAQFAAHILQQEGWPREKIEAVQHCILAHRYRYTTVRPLTIEAKVLYDADKLDVLGALGIARTIAYAVLAHQPIYAIPSKQFMDTGTEAPGEPHSSYHEFLYKLVKIKDTLHTKTAQEIAQARHEFLITFYEELGAEISGIR
jgi:uncharacterized protein